MISLNFFKRFVVCFGLSWNHQLATNERKDKFIFRAKRKKYVF